MFDIDSLERQAHHQFMTMNPGQYYAVNNHAYLGHAAAYHAAITFTDYVESFGLPESQVKAQTLIIAYAKNFINSNIDTKKLRLNKETAIQYAMESLGKTIYNPNPAAWRVKHMTPRRAFEVWSSEEDGDPDDYERWGGDEYNYGNFGPNIHGLPVPSQPNPGAVNPPPVSNFNVVADQPKLAPERGLFTRLIDHVRHGDNLNKGKVGRNEDIINIIDPVGPEDKTATPRPVSGEFKFHGRYGIPGGYYGRVQISDGAGNRGAYAFAQAQRAKAAACDPALKLTKALISLSPATRKANNENKQDDQQNSHIDIYARLVF